MIQVMKGAWCRAGFDKGLQRDGSRPIIDFMGASQCFKPDVDRYRKSVKGKVMQLYSGLVLRVGWSTGADLPEGSCNTTILR